jgi:hypothetical protein
MLVSCCHDVLLLLYFLRRCDRAPFVFIHWVLPPYLKKYLSLSQSSTLKIMKERRLLAEQQAMREEKKQGEKTDQQQPQGTALLGASPSSFMSSNKKPSAAERIGYRRPRWWGTSRYLMGETKFRSENNQQFTWHFIVSWSLVSL